MIYIYTKLEQSHKCYTKTYEIPIPTIKFIQANLVGSNLRVESLLNLIRASINLVTVK